MRFVSARALSVVVMVCLMTTYIYAMAWSASFQDTARDMLAAYQIRHAQHYPLEGPILGGAVHLGPAWFYLMALPLWVHESWLSSALFAGFLASLKFPLAYWCGTKIWDRWFGLCWAICLAFPGWQSLEQLVFFNPNPAAAAMLGMLALVLLPKQDRAGINFAIGLVMALGLHIHPTTAPMGILPLLVLKESRFGPRGRRLGAMALGFLLPFMPYLWSQAQSGFPDFGQATSYIERQVGLRNLKQWPGLLEGDLWAGPQIVLRYVGHWPDALSMTCAALFVLMAITPILAIIARPQARRPVLYFAGAYLLLSLWVALLRPITYFYFAFVLAPAACALAAASLRMAAACRYLRASSVIVASVLLGLHLMLVHDMARTIRDGEGVLPERIVDLANTNATGEFSDVWFPAIGRQHLGRMLCASGTKMSLHGSLAYIEDSSLGLDLLMQCGRRDQAALGGTAHDSLHVLGMTRSFWRRSAGTPACWAGSLGTAIAVPRWGAGGLAIADGSMYPPRLATRIPATEHVLAFEAPYSHAVLVSNVTPGYQNLEVVTVSVDGVRLSAVARNDVSSLYVANRSASGPVRWELRFTANEPEAVDIVSFDPAAPAPSGVRCP